MYADVWLGFTGVELRSFLKKARFHEIYSAAVHRELEPPHFETLCALAQR
jgi:ArsR family transcriptional regulator